MNEPRNNLDALKERGLVFRPVRPEDVDLYKELFHSLSDDTIHQRFFVARNEPPPQVLDWFTKPQVGQEGFVAILQEHVGEKMLGIARIIAEKDSNNAEFAVVVGDQWQGQGIGSELMRLCLKSVNKLGVKTIRGVAMPHNRKMIALAKSLGFSIRLAAKARMVVMEWDVPEEETGS